MNKWMYSENVHITQTSQFMGYVVSESEDEKPKQPAIFNPIYWVIAVIILLLFKWDEISAWF